MMILRKNDSSTSLILFVYNMFMRKAKKDSLKLTSLLEILEDFEKTESSVRMSLSRAVKAGLLQNERTGDEVVYSLTPSGKETISLWNEGSRRFWQRYQLRQSSWDGKWHILRIDFSAEPDKKQALTEALSGLGFGNAGGGLWVCPYYRPEEVHGLLPDSVKKTMLEIRGELTTQKNIRTFVEEVYHLEKLAAGYGRFIREYGSLAGRLKEKREKGEQGGPEELNVLARLGWDFFDTAGEDAALPWELEPLWVGDEAALIMRELRPALETLAWNYLKKFN